MGTYTTCARPSLDGPAVQLAIVMLASGRYHPSATWLCTTCGLRFNALRRGWRCCATTSALETHGWRLPCTRRLRCFNVPLEPSSALSGTPLIVTSSDEFVRWHWSATRSPLEPHQCVNRQGPTALSRRENQKYPYHTIKPQPDTLNNGFPGPKIGRRGQMPNQQLEKAALVAIMWQFLPLPAVW